MYYRHNLDFKYPDRSDEHMIKVKRLRDINFDENYPYLKKGFWYGVLRVIYFISLNVIMFPLLKLSHGLRIYGRENLKKYKNEFKNGAITISNHVFMWDFLCVSKAVRPHMSRFPAWKINLYGPNGPLIRMAGGIPIPTGNMRAMVKFKQAVEEVLENKQWLHFFPEGSMWFFYPDVRPFKKAVFKYAVKYDRPIIPLAMTFRDRKGITKLFTKRPFVDIHIGEPLFVNKELPPFEAIDDLHKRAYHVMQVMCGINPGDPTYNVDQNIDNYKKTM
ncbi:MAG: 1-acyl-sn-glycerol-3-phosphate acyltransferase [Clostridia bacterium]|nr:1-acyl-sn-glycerol-3-phosphate acyltransferase [Clostridia bacterium]